MLSEQGLDVVEDFITLEEETELLRFLDAQPWNEYARPRRTMQFGLRLDFINRKVDQNASTSIPSQINFLGNRLLTNGLVSIQPDQVLVNEYLPGQGIVAHTDQPAFYREEIASISLGSNVVFEFGDKRKGITIERLIPRRSVFVMGGEVRYHWTHCLPARERDVWENLEWVRERRVSLTFRKINFNTLES
eukprot:TRINITY_DN2866_c0_g1_i2.p1 TRINITY_DN2866_c0_g1~~TRINITY_DN2866_c0_g1_i2.p1  ORF type:complete len:191 (-),score=34.86 TRINITY_DN2866_c0_g1_i2:105-677(-)